MKEKNSTEMESSNLHHHALEFVNWEKEIKIFVYLQHFYVKVWVM